MQVGALIKLPMINRTKAEAQLFINNGKKRRVDLLAPVDK